MNKEDIEIGIKVIYSRGAKNPMIGKQGVIVSELDEIGIVMVDFEHGYSPCYYKNLEKAEDNGLLTYF